ncbi:MAG: helix-turn-helix domain-containing protein [Sphingomonadales bacterium]|nr:helix-turn-helix domain-containing protein [Sphingomonadales bacterium]
MTGGIAPSARNAPNPTPAPRVAGPSSAEGTQALGRAIDVLRAVARIQRFGASLAAITRATGLSRTTAFRIVHFLCDQRLLGCDQATGHYSIGPLAFELGLAAGDGGLVASWRPQLDRLSRLSGMTAYLVGLSGTEVVCLARAEADTILRAVPLVVGQRLPLGVGAGSLALLAALDDDQVSAMIAANARGLHGRDGARLTPSALRARIDEARRAGFAISENLVAEGVCGIGIALPTTDALAPMAISVAAPRASLDLAELPIIVGYLRDAAGLA